MSWLTTCPHCRTTFRVGEEQLAAHGGDVRCGKCQYVFNAKLALKPETEPEPDPSQEPEPPHVPEEVPVPETAPEEIAPPADDMLLLLEQTVELEAVPEAPAEEVIEEIVILPPPGVPVSDEPHQEAAPLPETVEQAFVPSAVEEDTEEKPRRSLTWLWVMASLFLLLSLAVQGLYTFRVELAARSPAMKPLLVQLCGVLQCQVGLPRHVETLGIEGSDLQADPQRPGVLILSAVLRSRAVYAQQYPLLELTLTDTADKALVRRVFQPTEYLPKGRDLAAGMPAQAEMAVRLNLQVSELQPVGYRLYLFYPRDAAGDS